MLQSSVSTLQQLALIGKFSMASLSFMDIKNWAFKIWSGLKDIFYHDSDSNFFIAIFNSKDERDAINKQKGWFCQGVGLYTMFWIPKFNLGDINI